MGYAAPSDPGRPVGSIIGGQLRKAMADIAKGRDVTRYVPQEGTLVVAGSDIATETWQRAEIAAKLPPGDSRRPARAAPIDCDTTWSADPQPRCACRFSGVGPKVYRYIWGKTPRGIFLQQIVADSPAAP
jgi:hypothetical protein